MRRRSGLAQTVRHGHRHPYALQHPQVNKVVTNIAHLRPLQPGPAQHALHGGDLVHIVLMQEIDLQVLGALGRRTRRPARNPPDFDPLALQQAKTEAVADVKSLRLDSIAHPNRAVGQYAVHVAEKEFDHSEARAQVAREFALTTIRHDRMEAPNTKLQAPGKLQIPTSKLPQLSARYH